MNVTREHPYAPFAEQVAKPARYLGGEYNSVVKDWASVSSRFCLCFPDVYDIGMSHMGTKILYSIVNKTDDLLMERCFTPWFDMEEQLRERDLPLVSLETWRPLVDFDVVGFSLQYEMTYTNIFTMLDLGGVPLRNADRTLAHPLVIAGGPTATHPEPMAPFIDVFLIGDAEERLPRLLRHWAEMVEAGGRTRLEMIAELAKEGGLYCPDLYELEVDESTGLQVVGAPRFEGVPERVERAFLDDISRYRFPDDSPVAVAEAIFDRMSVEIARGCTEGCRFCQAGMIYRPVRERDPDEIIDTVLGAVEKGGYDEAAITALSTADYSCISPLIKKLMGRLRERKVSLGISSLRAYGLDDDLLDEIATVKATGLTFAPEAGTQRMRDVINKNITEDDIFATCHRVFSKGWRKMKLYFILGLPTETDEDIVGIAKMGRQAKEIGEQYHRSVNVTVSVSSHVPKPHTPFQWAAMDSLEDIERKQHLLLDLAKQWGFKFRRHDMHVSHLECITGRGDRSVGEIVYEAWRDGARFDSWDEHLALDAWDAAISAWETRTGQSRQMFFDTLPIDCRTPWDHIDVGLEDGFLLREYRKSLKSRLSPPCGKPKGAKVHHTNLEEALAEEKKLVCYHCGIACDLTQMKQERIEFLDQLGAEAPAAPRVEANVHDTAMERVKQGLTPHDFDQGEKVRVRLKYQKLDAVSFQGHLDLVRILPRIMRRAGLTMWYSEGFSPKPVMTFGPALSLGARSLGEYMDVAFSGEVEAEDVLRRMNESAPDGLLFTGARRVFQADEGLAQSMNTVDFLVTFDVGPLEEALASDIEASPDASLLELVQARIDRLVADPDHALSIVRKKKRRERRLWDVVQTLRATTSDAWAQAAHIRPGSVAVYIRQWHGNGPSLKPLEIAAAVVGDIPSRDVVRLGGWFIDEDGTVHEPLHYGAAEPRDTAERTPAQARALHRGNAVDGIDAIAPAHTPDLVHLAGAPRA